MKIRELVTHLMLLNDPEIEVWISKDEEGNGFSQLAEPEVSYLQEDKYESSTVHPDDICDHQTEEECDDSYDNDGKACEYRRRKDLKKVVVLWP